MLHRVVENRGDVPKQRELEVTPDWLEQKILEYKFKGYTFISLDELPSNFNSHRWVCITFDDGYRDNYALAYPLLKKLGVPFTVYVTTGFIDNKLPMWWYPDEHLGISYDELKQLDADPLCTIGAHTMSHPKLDTLTREQQYQEIAESKQALEDILGHKIRHFSFPHGAYNEETLDICHELGFQTVVKAWGEALRHGEDRWLLPRVNMKQDD
ncbi:MAG: polysaccharide deacetylase family protein [Bacteroidales bacterium]|nr:polysaccharide deacetylase family protein [Bacteroidales bacterium]